MRQDTPAYRAIRWGMLALGLALPVLTLVPLGSYWLWEHGVLFYWAIFACLTTVLAWGLQRWALAPAKNKVTADSPNAAPVEDHATWTPAENMAWQRVGEITSSLDPTAIKTRSDLLELGQRTVEAVAKSLHPERTDPLLQFTTPEALALIERVAARMNTFIRTNVPLGDRLTIAQMRTLYEWRGSLEVAEQAWSVWRVVRMLNPASALANEVRERVSKELMTWGKSHIARRLATVFIEEVGSAAIDLYGGRLRISSPDLGRHLSEDSARDLATAGKPMAEPLRALVAGQVSAGKSSLVNALGAEVRAAVDALPATARFTPYRLQHEGLPAALIIDSPGLVAHEGVGGAFIAEAERADLILWVVAANRADREVDRDAIEALRTAFAARPDRRPPPMMVVLTHIDRLRPFTEWNPPYDLADQTSPKAQSIRAAAEATADDLGFAPADVIPCSLAPDAERYNVDAVWAAIANRLPQAQAARLVRTLRDAQSGWDAGQIWRQVASGGRVLAGALRKP